MGRKRKPGTPDATMQLDAIVDDLEEIEAPALLRSTAPPPLPPRQPNKSTWLIGGAVVLIAATAAVGVGLALRAPSAGATPAAASAPPPSAPAAPREVARTEQARTQIAPTQVAQEEPAADDGPAHVQLEAFVFDDEAPPNEQAAASDAPAEPADAPAATE
ncbi:MAG: hypothetical protein KF729_16870 [Sandaracinaceae bacterium]|nr:hypothetical protein [Sandaracinaceae bacterium]